MPASRDELLQAEVRGIEHFLAGFQTRLAPMVGLGPSGETVWVKRLPLPDHMQPDHLDIVMVVRDFPVDPPRGIFLLSSATHDDLIASLKQRFNVFQDRTYHGAPGPVPGYEWLCFGYLNGWRYNVNQPHRGDNIAKMLAEFWRALEEERP